MTSDAELVRRFEAAEAAVFPLAMVDPDLYQRATLLVSAIARRLDADGVDPLGTESVLANPAGLLGEVAESAGLSSAGLVPSQLVEAAFAHLYRQQLAETAARGEQDLIDAAVTRGDRWLVLSEPSDEAQLMGSMQWVELHLGTRRLLYRSIEMDRNGSPRFVVETRAGAPGTADSPGVRHETQNRDEWVALGVQVREELDGIS